MVGALNKHWWSALILLMFTAPLAAAPSVSPYGHKGEISGEHQDKDGLRPMTYSLRWELYPLLSGPAVSGSIKWKAQPGLVDAELGAGIQGDSIPPEVAATILPYDMTVYLCGPSNAFKQPVCLDVDPGMAKPGGGDWSLSLPHQLNWSNLLWTPGEDGRLWLTEEQAKGVVRKGFKPTRVRIAKMNWDLSGLRRWAAEFYPFEEIRALETRVFSQLDVIARAHHLSLSPIREKLDVYKSTHTPIVYRDKLKAILASFDAGLLDPMLEPGRRDALTQQALRVRSDMAREDVAHSRRVAELDKQARAQKLQWEQALYRRVWRDETNEALRLQAQYDYLLQQTERFGVKSPDAFGCEEYLLAFAESGEEELRERLECVQEYDGYLLNKLAQTEALLDLHDATAAKGKLRGKIEEAHEQVEKEIADNLLAMEQYYDRLSRDKGQKDAFSAQRKAEQERLFRHWLQKYAKGALAQAEQSVNSLRRVLMAGGMTPDAAPDDSANRADKKTPSPTLSGGTL
ncbi:hypothetical protein O5O45_20765 [Hahella aquimaris]|uniref:hypothetical protein n=1 Tax=Hahella sp. HNIBRBA332 TaxID=3015983 RepID=UPI00273BC545|nr:hypothetical protein [Hahella sp. HNIBRBA332]WLQ12161.1 hypothetical protein O5O45_20765 [Hahella sp. HNIBRBA332]